MKKEDIKARFIKQGFSEKAAESLATKATGKVAKKQVSNNPFYAGVGRADWYTNH